MLPFSWLWGESEVKMSARLERVQQEQKLPEVMAFLLSGPQRERWRETCSDEL